MSKKKLWDSPSLLPNCIVFVDGVTRSGKSMLGPVVSSLSNTYPIQQQTILDNLLPIFKYKSIRHDVIKSILNFYFNKNLYYLNISREINLRPGDSSSVVFNKDYKSYLKNLKIKDGDHIIKKIRKKNYYPIYMTHDLLSMVNEFYLLKFPFKLMHIYRHPIDNIFSFYKRYQLRLSSKSNDIYNIDDPRIHQMMIKVKGKLLPYYVKGSEKIFLKYNFLEKVVFYYLNSINNSIKSFKKLSKNKKKNILIIKYDDFTKNVEDEIKKILKFLNTKKTNYTKTTLKKNNLPRKINTKKQRNKKLEIIKKNISPIQYKQVLKIIKKYEQSKLFV